MGNSPSFPFPEREQAIFGIGLGLVYNLGYIYIKICINTMMQSRHRNWHISSTFG
jgi:hypothetical protein